MFALYKDNNQDTSLQIFNVGNYVRLSKEDENTINESESVANQKDFLTRYVISQGWNLVDTFVDDGYTGTNFNRPGFQRLLKAIESGKINLVITKDLSRLGRDYIDTGHYVERYFPENNVRYIALNDGIDTFESHNSNNDMSPFKSVMNDFYARDISKKVRTAMNTKRQNGKFVGSFTPYGYLKDPQDKNALVIDPMAAPVVKKIFDMYLSGHGYANIAHTLNDEGLPSPGAYKRQIHKNYNNRKVQSGLWTLDTVKSILVNTTYTGCMTQRKKAIISYKVKKFRTIPRESWLTIENTHEPIVDKDTFQQCQYLMSLKGVGVTYKPKVTHLLGGLLFCKDCGSRLTFTKTQKGEWYCICSYYKRFKKCSRHSYHEQELVEYVLQDLRRIAQEQVDPDGLLKEAERFKPASSKKISPAKELEGIHRRLEEIKKIIKTLYEDKLKGIISEQDFMDLSSDYNKEREALSERMGKLNKAKEEKKPDNSSELLKIVQDLVNFNNVSKLVLTRLVEKIEIDEKKHITIYYNFKNAQ